MSMTDANEMEEAGGGEAEPTPTPATTAANVMDPRLLMAACRGDGNQLKELLLLQEVENNNGDSSAPVDAQVVVVEVDSRAQWWSCCIARSAPAGTTRPADDDAAAPPPPPPPSRSSAPLAADGLTIEGDSLLHVVAACGDGDEFIKCAKMIVLDKEKKGGAAAKRLVLEARNGKGDTPLHCAAGAGNVEMISCLVGLASSSTDDDVIKAFLRTHNHCGETALHQAVRAPKSKRRVCIDKLMAMDSELACIPPHHPEGASPLYLAISLGDMETAHHLFDKTKGKLSYSGPDGRNALHAAVSRGQALRMLLGWIKDLKTPDMQGGQGPADLLRQLTSQRDRKQNGSTPLHLAASLDGWLWEESLTRKSAHFWVGSESAMALLVDANESTVYQADDQGSYPIHVAAWSFSLDAVKMLLQRCPECATLRDGRGRTFLHVAAEEGSHRVVQYVCRVPELSSILNAQDKNGDTALHRAVHAGTAAVSVCLIRNRQISLDVPNKDGMTPLDLSRTMIPPGFRYPFNPSGIIRLSLMFVGAPHGGGRPEPLYEKWVTKRDRDKESEKHTQATQTMSIVTVLIA